MVCVRGASGVCEQVPMPGATARMRTAGWAGRREAKGGGGGGGERYALAAWMTVESESGFLCISISRAIANTEKSALSISVRVPPRIAIGSAFSLYVYRRRPLARTSSLDRSRLGSPIGSHIDPTMSSDPRPVASASRDRPPLSQVSSPRPSQRDVSEYAMHASAPLHHLRARRRMQLRPLLESALELLDRLEIIEPHLVERRYPSSLALQRAQRTRRVSLGGA